MLDSRPLLLATDFPVIKRGRLDILQVNLGYKCNLSCVHCHVNAGPSRTELMDRDSVDLLLDFTDRHAIKVLDLTGGAPEMNPHFRYLVNAARARDIEVIDRCNLTILLEPGYEDVAEFLASQQVTVSASLPCYQEENVEAQRGKGVYGDSIEALHWLNELGYGRDDKLQLNLVYNPVGPVLPPPQEQLEIDYKRELKARFGIEFNQLFTITNMPISRFGSVLMSHGEFNHYIQLLKDNFSAENLTALMCRHLVSVDWQGFVYDCDFNQMLELPLIANDKTKIHLSDLLDSNITGNEIAIGDHCFGCTAGQGSSCGGALND
ncbi:MAG: arsenosugar biosynthesis radical SAM (seleno)protein ArsS [Pseudomonadales bacterium]